MLTKSLTLPHTYATANSAALVHALSNVFDSRAALCWLHHENKHASKRANNDVIGLYPKWKIQVTPRSSSEHNPPVDKPTTELVTLSREVHPVDTTADIVAQLHYQKLHTEQLTAASVQSRVSHKINEYITAQQQHQHRFVSDNHNLTKKPQGLSFSKGLMGFVSYDLSAAAVTSHAPTLNQMTPLSPLLCLGHYDIYLKKDNRHGEWQLHFEAEAIAVALAVKQQLESALTAVDLPREHAQNCYLYHLTPYWDKSEYSDAFHKVQNYLKAGDCYQVNLAQNITANYTGNPATLLETLHEATRAPYAGYMQVGDYAIISCSPELFLNFKTDNDKNKTVVTTKPIKGTLPRLADPVADAKQVDILKASEKNQAENLMIVDLLRNDLSVYAKTGSVNVPKLFEIESFAQVHHMVSTISAQLADDVSAVDVLLSALPGGSITGAPKIRAIEIIHELEKQPRGAYCGSMGYLNFDGTGEWNILIRTLQFWQGKMSLWAGGGITIASDCDDEYQECVDKISGILAVLKDRVVDLDNTASWYADDENNP